MGKTAKATTAPDPWAEHVTAMDEQRVTIAELEHWLHEPGVEDEAPQDVERVRTGLAEAQNRLRSLELAYNQHVSYEAAHQPVTISADDEQEPAATPAADEPEE